MFNYAGAEFDFGNVVYAVLTECEHRRRALDPENAAGHLRETAVARLDRIGAAYTGADVYWQELRREVEQTALPRYLRMAVDQLRAERSGYSVWRRGDLLARLSFALMGLGLGAASVASTHTGSEAVDHVDRVRQLACSRLLPRWVRQLG